MGILNELLRTAYAHMDAGNPQSARTILESLVNIDPTNAEAWEVRMQISESCAELDRLCDQMLNVVGINPAEREAVLEYYYFLRQKLRIKNSGGQEQKMVTFELVDEFTYTLKNIPSIKPLVEHNDGLIEYGLAWLLGKSIIVVYLALLVAGLQLVQSGNNFGYWIIMVLAISIIFNLWNTIARVEQNTHPLYSDQSETKDTKPKKETVRVS